MFSKLCLEEECGARAPLMQVTTRQTEWQNGTAVAEPASSTVGLQPKSPKNHRWCDSLTHSREGSPWKLFKRQRKGFH